MVSLVWTNPGGGVSQLVVDATEGDTHTTTATPTEHPVEKDVAITDHVRPGPLRVSLQCVISNSPIDLPPQSADSFTDGVSRSQATQVLQLGSTLLMIVPAMGPLMPALVIPQQQSGQAQVWQFSAQFDRVKKVYEALVDAQLHVCPFEIHTTLRHYTGMILTSMPVPRTVETGANAIRFNMDFQQIRTVESQTVKLPAPAAQTKHRGHKEMKQETDPKKTSTLHNIVASAKAALGSH